MENARIAIFEDNEQVLKALERLLTTLGHVTVSAATMQEAKQLITNVEKGGIDVALVDGSMTPFGNGVADGEAIIALIREKLGESVNVVNMSGSDIAMAGEDVKTGKEISLILGHIERL